VHVFKSFCLRFVYTRNARRSRSRSPSYFPLHPHCLFFRCLRSLLNCGVRLGCPLSRLLFLLGIELLNLAILPNDNVKGIKIGDEVKIMLCANDTALFSRDLPSVNSLLQISDQFKNYLGLELNKDRGNVARQLG